MKEEIKNKNGEIAALKTAHICQKSEIIALKKQIQQLQKEIADRFQAQLKNENSNVQPLNTVL